MSNNTSNTRLPAQSLFTDRLVSACYIVSLLQICSVCLSTYSDSCFTVSCLTDSSEIADRIGVQALTLQIPATVYVWHRMRLPLPLSLLDACLLSTVALVSTDVSKEGHRYVSLAFVCYRLVVSLVARFSSISSLQFLCLFSLRILISLFTYGYSCVTILPFCFAAGWASPLPPLGVLVTELGFFVFGTAFFALSVREDPPSEGAREYSYAFLASSLLSAVRAITSGSLPSAALLCVPLLFDLSLGNSFRSAPYEGGVSGWGKAALLSAGLSGPTILSFVR